MPVRVCVAVPEWLVWRRASQRTQRFVWQGEMSVSEHHVITQTPATPTATPHRHQKNFTRTRLQMPPQLHTPHTRTHTQHVGWVLVSPCRFTRAVTTVAPTQTPATPP